MGGGAGIAFDTIPIAAGEYHTCAISKDNVERCWGYGSNGRLGDAFTTNRWEPVEVNMPSGRNVTSFAAGYEQTCGIMDNGFLYCWGYNGNANLGDGTTTYRYSPQLVSLPVQRRAASVSTDYSHTCAILDDRSLWCWGSDSDGALSYDRESSAMQPFPVRSETPETKVRAVSTGQFFTCIISHNYEVWCTGENGNGQLGDSSSTDRQIFVKSSFPAGSRMVAIESGQAHSCSISDTGNVYCWGNGGAGRLGDGNTTSRTSPVRVTEIAANRTAVALSLAGDYSCAILDDGNVTCWGYSRYGAGSSPTFSAQRTAVAIAAGFQHMCAVLDDGQIVCWGYKGQIGDNQAGTTSIPTNPTGFGTNTTQLGSRDMDGDGFENVLDNCHDGSSSWTSNPTTDHDDDGCEDATEDTDDDEDGLNDADDSCARGLLSGTDHDGDGCFNLEDVDDDNDGFNDTNDSCSLGLLLGTDHDSDGCKDAEDGDDDDDGREDDIDACPTGLLAGHDSDSDGCFDAEDRDDDNDSIMDENDHCRNGTLNWYSGVITDHDTDGCQDAGEDTDDDNDGLNDTVDLCPLGLLAGPDHDMDGCRDDEDRDDDDDGRDDIEDACPRGMRTGSDQDNDGCTDAEEGVTVGVNVDIDPGENCSKPDEGTDPDGDGCSNDEDYDDDGDGVADADDRCPLGNVGWRSGRITDWDADGCNDQTEDDDDDDDGITDAADACPTGRLGSDDHDLDGCGDNEDSDDDQDGVADLSDACPRGMSTGPDEDGDGCKDNEERTTNVEVEVGGANVSTNVSAPDVIIEAPAEDPDADGDGLRDADDFCPNGQTGWKSGRVLDFDGDGCRDSDEDDDDDDDGVPDGADACSRTLPGVAMNESGCYSMYEPIAGAPDAMNTTTNTTETTTTESADLASSADLSGAAGGSSDTATVVLLVAILVTMLTLLLVVATSRRGGEHEFALGAEEPSDDFAPAPQPMDAAQLYGQTGPPITATGNVADDGYEWLEHEGQQYYRAPNAGQAWQVWG